MFKFFVEPHQIEKEHIVITGSDVNHISNVLRMKQGERLLVSTGNDREYLCELAKLSQDAVTLTILDVYGSNRELSIKVTLYQALPKGDKMETIIQKMVELGVHRIVPIETSRCVVKLDEKKTAKKTARWNTIAETAAKQSKRNEIPQVCMPMSFSEAIKHAKEYEYAVIPYENAEGMEQARQLVMELADVASVAVFIGPEGGFSEEEIALATEASVVPITLGHRILRTETAGMMLMSVIMFMNDKD